MSGNPFRRQVHQGNTAGSHKAKGKTKKVKFVSPVASPQEPPSHPRFPSLEELDDGGPKSPPPKGLADDPEAIDTRALLRGDVTAGGAVDLKANEREEAADVARMTGQPVAPTFQLSQPPPGRRGPPANPFARTLASIEAEASAGKLNYDATKQKQVMDVDSFKRMLLTGTPDAPSGGVANIAREQGSSTDSSFASRQSASDSGREARPGSPHFSDSSLEDASTEDESGQRSEDEVPTALTSTAGPSSPTKVQAGPQTVSFDDFDNEPLQESRIEDVLPGSPPATRATEKKPSLPPPPPTSRRTGHGKPHSRSSSNADAIDTDSQLPSRPKPPPPRTPASRQASKDIKGVVSSSDSVRTTSSDTVPTQQNMDEPETSGSKAKPPPPPSRNAAKQTPPAVRRMSTSSSTNIPRRTSPVIATGTPPPPPPRRGGDSKRSSLDSARPTGEYHHSGGGDRRDSMSSLEPTAEEAEAGQTDVERKTTADMLADLDAFQREVDALRAKAFGNE